MTPKPSEPPLQAWSERHLRAGKLLARRPQAAQLLEFLLELLPPQRELFLWSHSQEWLARVRVAGDHDFPLLRLERLPTEELMPRFAAFVDRLKPHATEVVSELASKLLAAPAQMETALTQYLARQELAPAAESLGCTAEQLVFFPEAFLQPIAEALAIQLGPPPAQWAEAMCPACGRLPRVALLRDDSEIKGRRMLECGLCATRWTFRRAVCPNCGEEKADQLVFHSSEDLPHLRVDECKSCHAYIKTVDLRKDGTAVPMVDELATVELDVWAAEQGLWKIQTNLLGI